MPAKNKQKKIKSGTKLKFMDIPIGHFFLGGDCIFQSVKSKDVMCNTFAPEFPVMLCYYSLGGDKSQFQKGQVTQDYFQQDFTYLCDSEKLCDAILEKYSKL
jgi:hypothetical protein